MPAFLKPENLNNVWASSGDRLYPGDNKYATGWQVEIPPRQYFNEIDYKQDQMIAHVNQFGIPQWDNETEYQEGKSLTQGSDGVIYKSLTTHTNINPVDDTTGAWEVAFVTRSELMGLNQSVAGNGFQIFPGNLIFQWIAVTGRVPDGSGSYIDITIPFQKPLSTVPYNIQLTHGVGNPAEAAEMSYSVLSRTTSSCVVRFRRISGSQTGTEDIRADVLIIGKL